MFLQIIFDSDIMKLKLSNIAVPPGYSNVFSYIFEKTLIGVKNQVTSLYAPWMHVSTSHTNLQFTWVVTLLN